MLIISFRQENNIHKQNIYHFVRARPVPHALNVPNNDWGHWLNEEVPTSGDEGVRARARGATILLDGQTLGAPLEPPRMSQRLGSSSLARHRSWPGCSQQMSITIYAEPAWGELPCGQTPSQSVPSFPAAQNVRLPQGDLSGREILWRHSRVERQPGFSQKATNLGRNSFFDGICTKHNKYYQVWKIPN